MSRGSRWVPPAPGMIPRRISGCPKLRAFAAHPEIGAQREFEAAAERVSGDRGHNLFGDPCDGGESRLQTLGERLHVEMGLVCHLLDIGAAREHLRAPVENGRPELRDSADVGGGLTQLDLHPCVNGVHRGPIEADGCQMVRHRHVH